MERYWLVIREGYVINRVIWDGIMPWSYSLPQDLIVEDVNCNVSIGDWYESLEGIFYKPLSTPPDLPEELN
jgi:hypothetical protein